MLKTPLFASHAALNAKMAPFGGWLMPIQYQGILAEHAHTRTMVSVFDICHMGEFLLEADPVESGFDRIITQNVVSMVPGSCRYGFILNERGGVLDDLVVYRLAEKSWMIVVNAATASADRAHFEKYLGAQARFVDVSDATGKLDVQGPLSRDVLVDMFGKGIAELKYYSFSEFVFAKDKCIISRTGYTGERGYELYVPAKSVVELWAVLCRDTRVKPAGLGCRDTLRLEMGYPLYGHELDTGHTPVAANLEKFVDLSKDFIGKAAVLAEKETGAQERLVCFRAESRRSPRSGFAIFDKKKRVGTVTSGSFSPSLSVGIGMGYVSGGSETGRELVVTEGTVEIPVKITQKPFLKTTH